MESHERGSSSPMEARETICPGCGLRLPPSETAVYDGYYNVTPECWSVYTEALAAEFSNAPLFGQVHQLTVDAYALQHAGGPHPDKSIGIHLSGLHLALVEGIASPAIPPLLQRLATLVDVWPRFPPPAETGPLTVFDVAMCDSAAEHAAAVRRWAAQLWDAWSPYHADIEALLADNLSRG